MMSNWLFLRGTWDNDVLDPVKNNSDMWMNLFMEMSIDENILPDILFKGNDSIVWNGYYQKPQQSIYNIEYKNNKGSKPAIHSFGDITSNRAIGMVGQYDLIFARGGFSYYLPILHDNPDAFKIYYGAGRKYVPDSEINYNLILCDSEKQKKEILNKYPRANVHLLIKPAAWHFKPVECKKEYDVCFIANTSQGHFKGIQWVYDTVPKDLKVLHLGNFTGKYKAPSNVTRKHVARIDMPSEISKCKVGIVPYWNQIDSCPRVIPEMLACGLPLVVADELNFWVEKYMRSCTTSPCKGNGFVTETKERLWPWVFSCFRMCRDGYLKTWSDTIADYYQNNLSIPVAARYIRDLIDEC